MRRALLLALAAGLAAAPATAARGYRCPDARGFTCHRITVPLDRTGALPGTLSVRFAAQRRRRAPRRVLVALTGGPGQPGVSFGPSFASEFREVLADHRLVVVDQRGTGGSGALDCPEVQGIDSLEPLLAEDVAGCARRLGPRRGAYGTLESVEDLEAIRRALHARKLAIYGVSYGTWVAQQYARLHPDRVERLVLDSVVASNDDPYDLAIPQALPRVLRGLCARHACRGITDDPFADLAAVVAGMRAGGPLRGTIVNRFGARQRARLTQAQLLSLLVASDLNPYLQARLPAALRAAREGDPAPLLRMRRDAAGPPQGLKGFSAGLFVTTTCLDQELPYAYSDPVAERERKARAALEAIPEQAFAPFGRGAVDVSSVPEICLHWPAGGPPREATGPLPDVPTLILSGGADVRTPLETARALARGVPHPQLVRLAGAGHDVGDADTTGCVRRAVRRFFADRPVGRPCRGRSVAQPLALVPPRRLRDVRPAPGVHGAAGRVVRAALQTVADAYRTDYESFYAGYDDETGGGLRDGKFDIVPSGTGDLLLLDGVVWVPGVALDGSVLVSERRAVGRIAVRAPHGLSGRLRLTRRVISGRLGRHRIRVSTRALGRTARPLAQPAAHVARRRP